MFLQEILKRTTMQSKAIYNIVSINKLKAHGEAEVSKNYITKKI